MQRFGFLYGGYSFQYWETVDMMRKLLIGAIPVFVAVQPQGSLQAVIGQVGCFLELHVILTSSITFSKHTLRLAQGGRGCTSEYPAVRSCEAVATLKMVAHFPECEYSTQRGLGLHVILHY